jgi:exopolyphosphatase/guanosine-5'-triphosphate,3'-diphosphate pyrophosphatase
MVEVPASADSRQRSAGAPGGARNRAASRAHAPCYAALDLGTNNCRLLIATPAGPRGEGGFRVVESFSRIVRLGEGLTHSGRLDPAAMERALAALQGCADRVRRRRVVKLSAVATQACRSAANGEAFIAEVTRRTGLTLRVIDPAEEARLSVAGCVNLLDREVDAALVIDVGGGSTELSWVDVKTWREAGQAEAPPVRGWLSMPLGVVTLAERFPEQAAEQAEDRTAWFRDMVEHVKQALEAFPDAAELRAVFQSGRGHLVGTSGAITSLAGLHLNLARYDRAQVDGLWLTADDCTAAAGRLLAVSAAERAEQPCIGPDRADLVLAGAAILQAVQEIWPCERVRVADRGLREGLLMALMSERGGRSRRRRGGR